MIKAIRFVYVFLDRTGGLMVRQQCLKLIEDSGNHKY
jgi:hypothetical protein